jgi:acetylornithine deacetylase/succinyl-diaminopimelate desuccinylase-like protein
MISTPTIDVRELVELTQALIAIESHENAKGREARISQYLLDWYKDAGIKVVLQPVEGKRANITASIPGVGQGPTLMLNGHLDTVPAGSMDRPFDPYVERWDTTRSWSL